MAKVIFYEKPGCANNSRQKLWLTNAGHQVEACNLLSEPWTRERLLDFFGNRPVAQWFNRAAPRVKSGAIVPDTIDAESAVQLMLAEPLLIHRPLMEAEGRRETGFDAELVDAWLGLAGKTKAAALNADAEACLHPQDDKHCLPAESFNPKENMV